MACIFEKISAISRTHCTNAGGVRSIELIEEAGISYVPRGVYGTVSQAPDLFAGYAFQAWSVDKNESLVRETDDTDSNHGRFYTTEIVTRISRDRAELLRERLKLADVRLAAKVTDKNGLVKLYRNLKVNFANNTGSSNSPNATEIRLIGQNQRPAVILM